ncbi:hypothetical protein [Dendronalium sp. ChiSLP03b]
MENSVVYRRSEKLMGGCIRHQTFQDRHRSCCSNFSSKNFLSRAIA